MTSDKKISLAENNLQRVNDWIANSDNKIGIIIAFQVGVIAFFTTKGSEIKTIALTDPIGFFEWILYLSVVSFIAFITISIIYSFKALYPDIQIRKPSLFFFASIASKKIEDFKKEFATLSEKEILEEINDQVYINSTIAKAKMEKIRTSITNFSIGVFSLLITLLLLPWLK